jgi:hypothetical protein
MGTSGEDIGPDDGVKLTEFRTEYPRPVVSRASVDRIAFLGHPGIRGGHPAPFPSYCFPGPAFPDSLAWGQNGAESHIGVPEGREGDGAVRHPTVERVVEPTAAANHAVRARSWPMRITSRRGAIIRTVPPVPTPLIHIPSHVI